MCIPPECLVDVYADVTLPNCAKRLEYPITLQGAMIIGTIPQLFVIRTLKEKSKLAVILCMVEYFVHYNSYNIASCKVCFDLCVHSFL